MPGPIAFGAQVLAGGKQAVADLAITAQCVFTRAVMARSGLYPVDWYSH